MFDTAVFTVTAPISELDELRTYVDEHTDGLLNAAALLGGQPGVRLARTAIDGLTGFGTPSCRTTRALDDLLDLLRLENVDDPCRLEAALFAAIDPASPVVEEICVLSDSLNARLEAYHDAIDEAETANIQQVAA